MKFKSNKLIFRVSCWLREIFLFFHKSPFQTFSLFISVKLKNHNVIDRASRKFISITRVTPSHYVQIRLWREKKNTWEKVIELFPSILILAHHSRNALLCVFVVIRLITSHRIHTIFPKKRDKLIDSLFTRTLLISIRILIGYTVLC